MKKKAIDLDDVLERVQDDWDLLLELLDIFEQDYILKRPLFDEFLSQKNFDKMRDLGHSLKGASGNISAKDLFESFLQIEKMAENKDLSRMEGILKAIDQQFVALQECIAQLKKDYKNR